MKSMQKITRMALAGTLLAGVSTRAQPQTPQVSAQEVTTKLQIAISEQHLLIDKREKLKTAYKADPKSLETHKLEREFCRDWLADHPELTAAYDAKEAYMRHPPFVPDDEEKIWRLGKQTDVLVNESWQLGRDLFSMGVTCPGVNTAELPAKPSSENPIEGQMMLVVLFAVGLVVYFLPSVLGDRKRNRWAIFALNLLAGWTLIGWVVALVWALTKDAASAAPIQSASGQVQLSCESCGKPPLCRCDYPVVRNGKASTCDRILCKECSTEVDQSRHYCKAHAQMGPPAAYCGNCGSQISGRFCANCGEKNPSSLTIAPSPITPGH